MVIETSNIEKEIIDKLESFQKVNVGELTLELEHDEDAENPLEDCDGTPTFVCFHNRYRLGTDDHSYEPDMFSGWAELEKQIIKEHKPWAILPLYLYDHSGLTIGYVPFGCPWDSGPIGFAFYSKKQILQNWGYRKRTAKRIVNVEESLKGWVEAYDKYLRGEIYSYVITDRDGEIVDSCGGYYSAEEAAYACVNYSDVKLDLTQFKKSA